MCELLKYKDDAEIRCVSVILPIILGVLKVSAGWGMAENM